MFKVENAPHPDVNPNAELGTVTVIGGDPAATYEVVYNPDPARYTSLQIFINVCTNSGCRCNDDEFYNLFR